MQALSDNESKDGGDKSYLFFFPHVSNESDYITDSILNIAYTAGEEIILLNNPDRSPDDFDKRLDQLLQEEPEDGSNYGWWDQYHRYDDNGIKGERQKYILESSNNFEIWGGPLEDIGVVVQDLSRHSNGENFDLNSDTVVDFSTFQDGEYYESSTEPLSEIMKQGNLSIDERLSSMDLRGTVR